MIKINLIQQKKARSSSDPAQQVLLAVFACLIGLFGGLYVLVDMPINEEIEGLSEKNAALTAENQAIESRTRDYDALKKAVDLANAQKTAIDQLNNARAVPAWLLAELSRILTVDGQPTMTDAMARRVRDDPNRAWAEGWDPKHVWVTSFTERGGRFTLAGTAQSDSDMTQLALRMQASVYFDQVVPEGGRSAASGDVQLYSFTISGIVRY